MTQRLTAFLILGLLWVAGAYAAAPDLGGPLPPAGRLPDERYMTGSACLARQDITCAQVALAGIPPTSAYAKVLEAQIASAQNDDDTVLRLLLPLQVETNIKPAALASLHATLARAYERQGNVLRAVEERAQADGFFDTLEASADNQQKLMAALTSQPKAALLEMRGESSDTAVQGWIDLALAVAYSGNPAAAVVQWRRAYPDHRAHEAAFAAAAPAAQPAKATALSGKIALLLPIETPTFAFAAEAVRSGFLAAKIADGNTAEVTLYPTHGTPDDVAAIYREAVAEGAQYVVGPMTRLEVPALLEPGLVTVPTLALNLPDENANVPEKLVEFGLPVEDEAAQLARAARNQGMQTAVIAASSTPLGKRMAQAFAAAWTEQGGAVVFQAEFGSDTNLVDFKAQIASEPADMLFLAATADEARRVRPYLPQAVPTYALSHVYDGDALNPQNSALNAIHFVDMPWLLEPAESHSATLREASSALTPSAQRWFAVGVDAWQILGALASGQPSDTWQLRGLTGTLSLHDHRIQRALPLAQFRNNGVALE
jgi:outer membrane PBP1 activator LpoA protein